MWMCELGRADFSLSYLDVLHVDHGIHSLASGPICSCKNGRGYLTPDASDFAVRSFKPRRPDSNALLTIVVMAVSPAIDREKFSPSRRVLFVIKFSANSICRMNTASSHAAFVQALQFTTADTILWPGYRSSFSASLVSSLHPPRHSFHLFTRSAKQSD